MKYIYLFPSPNKYYKIRDEEFVINGLKQIGHEIITINNFCRFNLIVKYLIYNPDAIIFSSLRIGKKINFIIKIMLKFKIPIYWWYFDSANADKKRLKTVKKVAKNVSFFFNRDKINFDEYKEIKINPIWLDQAVPNILKNNKLDNDNFDYDVGFFGSLSSVHEERANLLKTIDKKFNLVIYTKDIKKFKKMNFKNVKNYIFKDKIPEAISKIKIILVLNSLCTDAFYWSDRVHIMIGSGAFCITEYVEGIDKTYKDNEHHVILKDVSKIIDKIQFWINKDLDRKKISVCGYNYSHKVHSYNSRVKEFINYIE